MAFARPIRERMVSRRRIQMLGNLVIFLVLGAQTVSAAQVPDPAVITMAGSAVSYAVIATLTILLGMTLMFSIGWAGVQEIVRDTPLQPDDRERLAEATAAGRQLAHIARSELGVIAMTFETLLAERELDPGRRAEIERALAGVAEVSRKVSELHEQVRSVDPGAYRP